MAAIPMPVPNVIIAAAPDPPGFYSHYASRTSFALGGIQIGAGVIALLIFMLVLAEGKEEMLWGYLSGSINYIIAGALGIAAGHSKKACQIIAFMVLSIFASMSAVGQAIGHAAIPASQKDRVVVYILGIIFLVESIVSSWSAIICCNAVCCGRRHNQRVAVGFQTQAGHVVMTPEQMPLQTVYGMSPPGYTGNPEQHEDLPPKY